MMAYLRIRGFSEDFYSQPIVKFAQSLLWQQMYLAELNFSLISNIQYVPICSLFSPLPFSLFCNKRMDELSSYAQLFLYLLGFSIWNWILTEMLTESTEMASTQLTLKQ